MVSTGQMKPLYMTHLPIKLNSLLKSDESISSPRVPGWYCSLLFKIQQTILLINNSDPDRVLHFTASELSIQYLSALGLYNGVDRTLQKKYAHQMETIGSSSAFVKLLPFSKWEL